MRYLYFPNRPRRLTVSFVKRTYAELIVRSKTAETSQTPDQWLQLFSDWNALKAYLWGESARIRFAYDRNMIDSRLEAADTYLREKVGPATDKPEHQLVKALLASKHKQAIANRFGPRLLVEYEHSLKTMDPINTTLGVEASTLSKAYEKDLAGGTVLVLGRRRTISEARTMLLSPDAEVRRAAYMAHRNWFLDRHTKFSGIYDKLVKIRTQMAKNVGYENFVPLGYEGMGRVDYGRTEVEKFRAAVKKHIVPLAIELATQQAKGLKTASLQPWDMLYFADSGLPSGIAPVSKQLHLAQKLFEKLSPDLAKHFKYMRSHDLIDLEVRKNKRTGGYCSGVPDTGEVQILCNSVGDADDIHVLTHEMGHAFQGWETNSIEAVELKWPSSDLCEVFSMGMEFLCLPHINIFFGNKNAMRFSKNRFRDSIDVLVYVCIVDEFQHWVYEHPDADASSRDEAWIRIWKSYRPAVDFSSIGDEYIAARWYAQAHIFSIPFYYIDYALAETGALQLALLNDQNQQKTLDLYLKMAREGGTKGIIKTFKDAQLRSPFDASLIRDLAVMLRSKILESSR